MNIENLLVLVWNRLPSRFFSMRSTTRLMNGKLSPYRTYLSITLRGRTYHAFIFAVSTKGNAPCTKA